MLKKKLTSVDWAVLLYCLHFDDNPKQISVYFSKAKTKEIVNLKKLNDLRHAKGVYKAVNELRSRNYLYPIKNIEGELKITFEKGGKHVLRPNLYKIIFNNKEDSKGYKLLLNNLQIYMRENTDKCLQMLINQRVTTTTAKHEVIIKRIDKMNEGCQLDKTTFLMFLERFFTEIHEYHMALITRELHKIGSLQFFVYENDFEDNEFEDRLDILRDLIRDLRKIIIGRLYKKRGMKYKPEYYPLCYESLQKDFFRRQRKKRKFKTT